MRHEVIKGRKNTRSYRVLEKWMRETATLLQGFEYYTDGYRPFDELEVPGTSVLVASAAAAGYLPIAEYAIRKINKSNRRTRRDGRADLWFVAGEQSFSFETKRAWDVSSKAQLSRCMKAAMDDASEIPSDESNYAFGVVISPVIDLASVDAYSDFDDCDYSFSIGNEKSPHVFFYFKKIVR